MGAKSSKSELSRRKSFGNIGRSSQRSLFQKSKVKLNSICREIEKTEINSEVTAHDRIKNDLDAVDNDLHGISEAVKVKNQEKYDEICKYLQNTRKKYAVKFNAPVEEVQAGVAPSEPVDDSDIVLRNSNGETKNREIISYAEEPRRPGVTFDEKPEDLIVHSEEPKRPSVKFGVQVLPPSPQISQVVLKRKTYPNNTSPKSEFLNIRNTTDGGFTQNGTSKVTTIQTSNSVHTNGVTKSTEFTSVLTEFTEKKAQYLKSNSIVGIEAINNEVNELEVRLKYFTGNKTSKSYIDLHQGFVNNLALLDNIDADEDPITMQEKRILTKRINELLKILECLVEQINGDCDDQSFAANRNSELNENTAILLSSGTEI